MRRLELTLPAAHRRVRMARNLVRRFARMDGIEAAELDTLILVVSELLGNAIDHGGGNAAQEDSDAGDITMGLVLELSAEGWRMVVSDQGGGDPQELASLVGPDALPDLEDERGRGFFLLSNMVDEIEVGRSADGLGVEVRVVRRLERGE